MQPGAVGPGGPHRGGDDAADAEPHHPVLSWRSDLVGLSARQAADRRRLIRLAALTADGDDHAVSVGTPDPDHRACGDRGPRRLGTGADWRASLAGWRGQLSFCRSRAITSSFHSWVRISRYRSRATR